MPSYAKKNIWHVTAIGRVDVEAIDEATAKSRGLELLMEGEGSLGVDATLSEAYVESSP
jgi:hypothetical protein